MGGLSEDFKAMREHSRNNRLKRQDDDKKIIQSICQEYSIDYKEIAPHHIRLSSNGIRIDIFPQHSRYHILNTQKRGSYRDIAEFLFTQF